MMISEPPKVNIMNLSNIDLSDMYRMQELSLNNPKASYIELVKMLESNKQ